VNGPTATDGHYTGIDLATVSDGAGYRVVSGTSSSTRLTGLSPLNLIVGANNCGKSRLLRALYSSAKAKFTKSTIALPALSSAIVEMDHAMRDLFRSGGVTAFQGVERPDALAKFQEADWVSEGQTTFSDIRRLIAPFLVESPSSTSWVTSGGAHVDTDRLHRALRPYAVKVERALVEDSQSNTFNSRVYIPVLRGLRPLHLTGRETDPGEGDFYAIRTARDYKFDSSVGTIFTGLTLYSEIRDLLLGSRDERRSIREYEEFLTQEVFDGRQVELIPRHEEDVVYFHISGDEERPIYALGDGIQALIILTFLPFTAKVRTLFFIEELDAHLHPGMQRKLLEVFVRADRLRRHQYFATTHSNHFLDMAADYGQCTTILARRALAAAEPRGFCLSVVTPTERLVLDELGARASSVFLANATIWVEGLTDRLYIREYLHKYLLEQNAAGLLREDTHYVFMEGGGANIGHFRFADLEPEELLERIRVASICSRSFVVADGDSRGKKRMVSLEAELGDKLFFISGKEIEHVLPLEVLRDYVASVDPALDVDALRIEDYEDSQTPLGALLDEKFSTEHFAYENTIKRKLKLCEFALQRMRDRADWSLTPEARRLCQSVVKFVCDANGLAIPQAPC